MSQKYYETAVLGATFLGLGAALRLKNVVLIEKGGLFGKEFVNSYKVCEPTVVRPKTSLGEHFLSNLKKRGLVSEDGEIYQAPAVYVVSSYLKANPMDILLMTEVIRIQKVEGYYHITVYHSGGFETILAKQLIDTTTMGLGYRAVYGSGYDAVHKSGKAIRIDKYLNAVITNPQGKKMDGLSFHAQSGLYTYTMPVNLNTSRYDAVEELCSKEKMFLANDMRISSIASDFSFTMQPLHEVIDSHFIWDPSTAYANLAEAFDRGVQIAEEEMV